MKKTILVIIILCLLSTGCQTGTYQRNDIYNKITYQVPLSWEKEKKDNNILYKQQSTLLILQSQSLSSKAPSNDNDIKSLLNGTEDGIYKNSDNSKPIDSKFIKIASNIIAKRFNYYSDFGNQTYEVSALLFLHDNIVYSLMFSEPTKISDENVAILDDITNSIKIIK